MRRGGATYVFDTINPMFMMSPMIVPGSTYWNMGLGLDRGEVKADAEGLNNMLNRGETIGWLGKVMIPHLDRFPDTKATFE